MKICECHSEYQVPLIGTYAFPGAEYWCPYCGETSGLLGAGRDIDDTEKMIGRRTIYKEYSKFYLDARGTLCCARFKLNDGMMEPKDMPDAMRKELSEISQNGWAYEKKATALLKTDVKEYPDFKCLDCELDSGQLKCPDSYKTDIRICKKWKREVKK